MPGKGSSVSPDKRGPINVWELAKKVRTTRMSSGLAWLRLANMRLHGREGDLNLLRLMLHNLSGGADATPAARPELLLVAGVSGTGKSSLVMRGLRDPALKMGMAFAGGKFDQKNAALPLSAFADAMSLLTRYVMIHQNAQTIKDGITEALGEDDAMLLSRAFPGCEDLFSLIQVEAGCTRHQSLGGGKDDINRLQYAVRRLLKAICNNLKGVVIFIDDLQWGDSATLDLIKSISLDSDIQSLLLVGAYREDEVPDSHPLALHLRETAQMGAEISTIRLGNLSSTNVKSLVAEALNTEDNEGVVATLATTIHKKTEGNAFFVLLFLRSLVDEKLLHYNRGTLKWMWDDAAVRTKLVTENVATIVVNKLRRFEEGFQNILKIASCLGALFSVPVLSMVAGALSSTEMAVSDGDETAVASTVSCCVDEFEVEGLWERDSEESCRFCHDQIQSAAFELIPPEKRDSFRGTIGGVLMEKLDPKMLEDNLFQVVSLRNCAMASISGEERGDLARMNLRAGLKASENVAFDTATVYFKAGIEHLGERAWQVDHDTMLQLCSEGANACFVNGDLETMNMLIDEVLSMDIEVKDKFRVFEIKVLALRSANKFGEAIETAINFRRLLGLSTPRNKPVPKYAVIRDFIKTSHVLRKHTFADIASLPDLKDERIIMGQRMLELMLTSAYFAQPTLFPLISFLLVRTSVKHGLNASSCVAFSTYGLILCGAIGQMQRGREMAKAVELMLVRPGMKRMKARSIFSCEVFIKHWTDPLQGTLTHLLDGYQSGLETGDVESTAYNLGSRGAYLYYSGRPLEGLEQELENSVLILEQLNHAPVKMSTLTFLLAVKKLRGVPFEENCMDFREILKVASETGNQLLRTNAMIQQLELYVIFQDWETAAGLLLEAGDLRPFVVGHFATVRFTFLEGLICLKVAQAATSWIERRKWTKKGQKSMKMLRGWLKKGNVNVVHNMHLLTAEWAVLHGETMMAKENFKSATTVASKEGFLQDKALAHELAGAFFSAQGDEYWANYNMECSQRSYSVWGAKSKLEEITRKKQLSGGKRICH